MDGVDGVVDARHVEVVIRSDNRNWHLELDTLLDAGRGRLGRSTQYNRGQNQSPQRDEMENIFHFVLLS